MIRPARRREPAPGRGVELDRDNHPVALLGGAKPAPVVSEPILRKDVEGREETVAIERLEGRRAAARTASAGLRNDAKRS